MSCFSTLESTEPNREPSVLEIALAELEQAKYTMEYLQRPTASIPRCRM